MSEVLDVSQSNPTTDKPWLWRKGQSGNPGGRPKPQFDIAAICRKMGPKSLDTLARLLDSEDERIQLAAANSILDRGFGKPVQAVTSDNPAAALTFLHLVAAKAWSEQNTGRVVDVDTNASTVDTPRDLMAPAVE